MSTYSNFRRLMRLCDRINPSSLTSRDDDKIRSAIEHGLLLAPHAWRGQKVLMLGCGDGFEVHWARNEMHWDAIGVTFNHEEIERSVCPEFVVAGDLHALPFGTEQFDAVYSKETLEHSPCPILALMEMNRVLKPHATFFHLIADGWDKQREWYHFSCLPDFIWCDLFRKAGFLVESTIGYPDVERCEFENKSYFGRMFSQVTLDVSAFEYKKMLKYENW